MDRRVALATTSRTALLDANGVPLPPPKAEPRQVDVRALPMVQGYTLPPGIEARFCREPVCDEGAAVVLWCERHEVAVIGPLTNMDEIEEAAQKMANALPGRRRRAA